MNPDGRGLLTAERRCELAADLTEKEAAAERGIMLSRIRFPGHSEGSGRATSSTLTDPTKREERRHRIEGTSRFPLPQLRHPRASPFQK